MVGFWTGPPGWLAYFHPVYRQQTNPPTLSFPFLSFTPPPMCLIPRPWQRASPFIYVCVCWLGEMGVAFRLRESFLLFIWGVPLGDALGTTFVESLTPTYIHTYTPALQHTHTHARPPHTHIQPHTFHPSFFSAAHWLGTGCCVTPAKRAKRHTHVPQRPPSLLTVSQHWETSLLSPQCKLTITNWKKISYFAVTIKVKTDAPL